MLGLASHREIDASDPPNHVVTFVLGRTKVTPGRWMQFFRNGTLVREEAYQTKHEATTERPTRRQPQRPAEHMDGSLCSSPCGHEPATSPLTTELRYAASSAFDATTITYEFNQSHILTIQGFAPNLSWYEIADRATGIVCGVIGPSQP